MAAPFIGICSDSSDSESDSEEKRRIKEALVSVDIFAPEKLFTGVNNDQQAENKQFKNKNLPPSKRPVEKFQQENNLEVTPEFRKFVGKKLSEFIDSSITLDEKLNSANKEDIQQDSGIRLFSSSEVFSLNDISHKHETVRRKRPVSSSSDSDEVEDRLASVAVSGDQILAHSQISRSSNVTHDSNDNTNSTKVKKKKKKKKKSKELNNINSSDTKYTDSGKDSFS